MVKNYYTTTEISEISGVTPPSINNWIKSGQLTAYKTPGGHYRIRRDTLINFLNDNNIPIPPNLKLQDGPRILIVEDDEDVREFIIEVVKNLKYSVETEVAVDGFMAGTKLAEFKPDLVILDIMLPGINGFEVCRQIRKEYGKKIKVLAITGYYSEENKRKILEAGADSFMKKPMFLDELKKVINKLILSGTNKYFVKEKEELVKGKG